ncbi:hypothetical protein FA15DRAFT_709492 [Coprinopsis marcescibilis]|uniref:Uncharacterized protein n=1 Tax=Coprinopsis marcescibilis TaxID=230819 RepID=A0A5C3KFG7_COPMA|nr:hypothetical protein FA15DRAFT_709492 [Coprinopsis marcescibilis]
MLMWPKIWQLAYVSSDNVTCSLEPSGGWTVVISGFTLWPVHALMPHFRRRSFPAAFDMYALAITLVLFGHAHSFAIAPAKVELPFDPRIPKPREALIAEPTSVVVQAATTSLRRPPPDLARTAEEGEPTPGPVAVGDPCGGKDHTGQTVCARDPHYSIACLRIPEDESAPATVSPKLHASTLPVHLSPISGPQPALLSPTPLLDPTRAHVTRPVNHQQQSPAALDSTAPSTSARRLLKSHSPPGSTTTPVRRVPASTPFHDVLVLSRYRVPWAR